MTQPQRQSILKQLSVTDRGLSLDAVAALREKFGFNEIPEKREPLWKLLFAQFQDVMVYILLAAVFVSVAVPFFFHGEVHQEELINAVVILLIVVINAALGFAQEWRAENAIAFLKKLSAPSVKVRRNGALVVIPANELVPGDLMVVEAGDRISADARVVASSSAEVDESSLTGESVPVSKMPLVDVGVHEFHFSPGMLYSSTLVTRGSAEAVVTDIGLGTEIGKITNMVMELKPPPTPLQLELAKTGKQIGILVLFLCSIIFVVGLARGMEPIELFFTAVSLAVAAVPEGLPAIVTICLAIGVQRMIKNNALIRKLDAVETLGNINVICADKTGTMTENKMKVTDAWTVEGMDAKQLVLGAASCNRAELPDIGDPTEIALLQYAEDLSVERLTIDDEEVPFTSEAKYMVTAHMQGQEKIRFYKGAPEVVAKFVSDTHAKEFKTRAEAFSKQGLRVLAVAQDDGTGVKAVGLLAMMDPPRKGVKDAIKQATDAGIRTIMITGDHPATALSVATSVGIVSADVLEGTKLEEMSKDDIRHALKTITVFARVQPKHKVKILEALQEEGNVVAMSGDGVNDAPALKRAHVGVGMGLKGTDVAREASAMVLTDDDYSTIVRAIAEGRRIYDNIKKFVIFLMRSNIGEVMTIAAAMFLGMPLPLLPLHILWVNLVTDSLPALALAGEPAEKGIMQRPPRKRGHGIFSGEWTLLFVAGFFNAILSLGAFWITIKTFDDLTLARTAALTTTIVYQLFMACSTRTPLPIWKELPTKNIWLLLAIAVSSGLHLLLLYTPLATIFHVKPIPLFIWEELIAASLVAFLLFEALKAVHKSKSAA